MFGSPAEGLNVRALQGWSPLELLQSAFPPSEGKNLTDPPSFHFQFLPSFLQLSLSIPPSPSSLSVCLSRSLFLSDNFVCSRFLSACCSGEPAALLLNSVTFPRGQNGECQKDLPAPPPPDTSPATSCNTHTHTHTPSSPKALVQEDRQTHTHTERERERRDL